MKDKFKKENESLEPVSMYNIAAKLFAHLAKAVIDEFGEDGRKAILQGVSTFGEERGRDIARRAAAVGQSNNIENYLTNYDMGRSELFEYEDIYKENEIEQYFTKCVFADQWKKDGMEEYGILYCQEIDPAIARGFNPNLHVVHDKHFFKDGICHFCFQMKKEDNV
ncbi:L-2-amino-thiazoline-4-carboxylic acid hydrolase [Petroclostridium sp. X23]|uniref:L-2-amino-thiazoline-4-carboxylic acid hydrolase n=1 Tax=Petroclostridium sp. X23 TaxID=3045146 RepID=UPI0024ADF62D|nr:L-2-amino-thiazoline-4-carboxylic acid hydrolase [Petroclostridium sp. X23]WHH61473.1 L-2-amino-thiazoline-4-carboxylic acid hydrolase [Petroclostridium sp. X23]